MVSGFSLCFLASWHVRIVFGTLEFVWQDETSEVTSMALVQTRAKLLSNASSDEGPLYVYVPIGKTGSSSMRQLMEQHNKKQGNQDLCKCVDPACTKKQSPDCSSEPGGYFLEGHWGYCDAVKGRQCKYVNVLREPVSRMISAYNFWCVGCAERGKYCGRIFKPYTCPDMSIVEYTKRYGNHYTRKFAAPAAPNAYLDGGDWFTTHGLTDAGFTHKLTDSDFHSALKNLQSGDVKNLALEDPHWANDLAVFLGDDTASSKNSVHKNGHSGAYEYVPSQQERQEMAGILDFDIRLYGALFGNVKKDFRLGLLEDDLDDAERRVDTEGDMSFLTV